jgi:hypothetical protein
MSTTDYLLDFNHCPERTQQGMLQTSDKYMPLKDDAAAPSEIFNMVVLRSQ